MVVFPTHILQEDASRPDHDPASAISPFSTLLIMTDAFFILLTITHKGIFNPL